MVGAHKRNDVILEDFGQERMIPRPKWPRLGRALRYLRGGMKREAYLVKREAITNYHEGSEGNEDR